MKIEDLILKIKRKWMKIRLHPIRVYCLHHVCAEFDMESMSACDWMPIDEFKNKVQLMRKDGAVFISLTEAYRHIINDKYRIIKYAVLTFDDGNASLNEILPWLEEQQIPVTLFINSKYLDGKSYRKNPREKYLTYDEVFHLLSPLIEIGSHGWMHDDATKMSEKEFKEHMDRNTEILSSHLRYVPFHAYTWGRHKKRTDKQLEEMQIIPVLIDRQKNYSDKRVIHRELM